MGRNLVLKLLPIVFYGLLFVFLAVYIQNLEWSKLKTAEVSWCYLVLASALALGMRYWSAFVWFALLRNLGAADLKAQRVDLLHVFAKSWLGRYIPGTAPWILSKIYFASNLGVSKNKLAVSSLLEGGLQVVVTLAIALAILLTDRRIDVIDPGFKLLLVAILFGCIVALMPDVFGRTVSLVYKVIKRKPFPVEHMADRSTILKGAGLYVIGAILGGLSFFFIVKAVYAPIGYNDVLFVLGASCLASAVSMVAIFAPSGIGVREGIQVLLLSLIMPVEFAILIAVVTRIWSVCVDFVFLGMTKAHQSVALQAH